MSTEKKSQESWSENTLGFWGCTAFFVFLISVALAGFLMLIAENLGSVEPLTKGHLAGLGFLVLLWGSLFSAYKWISDGTTLEDRLFFTVIVLAIIVSAFLVLYFQKDISFLDFVARLRTTIK